MIMTIRAKGNGLSLSILRGSLYINPYPSKKWSKIPMESVIFNTFSSINSEYELSTFFPDLAF